MKLTHKHNNKSIKTGMTLLELTVVILVLLSLIAILFVGARAWKRGSDRAGCIMNIRNVQQAVRGHQNMTNSTAAPAATDIYGSGTNVYLPTPSCPASGTYTFAAPSVGAAVAGGIYLTCDLATSDGHVPSNTSTW